MASGGRLRTSGARAGLSACLLLLCACTHLPSAKLPGSLEPTPWSHWTQIDGCRVHYVDAGPQGPSQPLLIVHGFLGSTTLFLPLVDAARAVRRVVMPDLPGCGLSDPPRGAADMELYLAFLAQFCAHLGLGEVALMGSSLGAQLCVRYAEEHRGQVSALVLCSPFGLAEQQKSGRMRLARSELLLRLAAPLVCRRTTRRRLLEAVGDDSLVGPQLVESYFAPFRTAEGRRVASQLLSRVAARQPLDPLLIRSSLPMLVLFGEKDVLALPDSSARYKKLVPDAKVVVFPGLGHMPHLEAPREVVRQIEAFLAGEGL